MPAKKKDDIEHTSGDNVNVIEKFQDYWKGEEVELSESATTHFSDNSLTGDHHILIKNFQGVLTLSYWNPRHTIICEDAIL